MEELACATAFVVHGVRQFSCQHLCTNFVDNAAHLTAHFRREIYACPSSRSAVPHIAVRYLDFEHLFKAESLGA